MSQNCLDQLPGTTTCCCGISLKTGVRMSNKLATTVSALRNSFLAAAVGVALVLLTTVSIVEEIAYYKMDDNTEHESSP